MEFTTHNVKSKGKLSLEPKTTTNKPNANTMEAEKEPIKNQAENKNKISNSKETNSIVNKNKIFSIKQKDETTLIK